MATKKTLAKSWQENYASFILGAIIVVILGLLVANFITQRNKNIEESAESQQAMEEQQKAEEAAKPGEYKVQADDSLSKIADKTYGDMSAWPIIAKANNISNPNVIWADMTLTLPSKDEVVKMKEAMTMTEYTVKQDDTLFKIAEQVYGDGSRWATLHRVNGGRRLPNGNPLIFVDQKLTIPR